MVTYTVSIKRICSLTHTSRLGMRNIVKLFGFVVLFTWPTTHCIGQDSDGVNDADDLVSKTRELWTTSQVQGAPDPPSPYQTEVVFPHLKFDEPIDLESSPGSERLFVLQRFGKIHSFVPTGTGKEADELIDIDRHCLGLALDPNFAENGFVYVSNIFDRKDTEHGSRVSRFVATGNPPRCDLDAERVVFTWPSSGHNGAPLEFGPDGYLYLGTGDGSPIADTLNIGQNINDLRGKIIRIDVHNTDDNQTYRIPADNPFVGRLDARPEIWAYGLRQPWKMSFDQSTGDLWVGNVGQDLWEQIYRVQRGGNYGWSVTEGSHPFRPDRERGPSPILAPIVEHDHAVARSITGGYVYRGNRLPALHGAYLYGDYDTGKIWSFRYDGETVSDHQELLQSRIRMVSFGQDSQGEIYVVDHMGGQLHQLVSTPASELDSVFPRQLSQTGLFASVSDHTPAVGVISFDINAPQWLDGANAQRFLAIPGDATVEFDTVVYPPVPGSPLGWRFPNGSVLVQTISLEMEAGNPASERRLETRLLHQVSMPGTEEVGDQVWKGYTYIWNEEQTDAVLLEDPLGYEVKLQIKDVSAPGGLRQQTWRFPSRTECAVCHNTSAKYALAANTPQMNRDQSGGDTSINQLTVLSELGIFTEGLPKPVKELPAFPDYRDTNLPVEKRARSYLHANCAHCHRKWGGGNSEFQLLHALSLDEMSITNVAPRQGAFYLHDARVVAKGAPYRSVLLYRMSKLGSGRMPRLGSTQIDPLGVSLVYEWIAQLEASGDSDGETPKAVGAFVSLLHQVSLGKVDAAVETVEQLLNSSDGAFRLLRAIDSHMIPEPIKSLAVKNAVASPLAHVRDLYERFLPEDQRVERLGNVIEPHKIVALPGSVNDGKTVFFDTAGVQCKSCHRINGQGGVVGPDLSKIGKKYTRLQILETILNPSKEIEDKYRAYQVGTDDGKMYVGIIVEQTDTEIVLRNAKDEEVRLPRDTVEQLQPQQKSLMPELLLRDMTAKQVADLTQYLRSLQ